jgi:hypothetical protein
MSHAHWKAGRLSPDAFPRNGLLDETILFIANALLPWRNDPDRPLEESEEALNAQLQNFLQCRAIAEFPMIVFQHEQRQSGQRRVDIGVHPTGAGKYKPFLVMEGKRLPAPSKDREREYVTGEENKISGGIQRFKLGVHGAEHDTAIIVGYIQKKSLRDWHPVINGWISELAKSHPEKWSANEKLTPLQSGDFGALAKSVSNHPRVSGCKTPLIRIHHFWIQMQ